jgi:hypothetical protein
MRAALILLALAGAAFGEDCLKSVTADELLKNPEDPELSYYASCVELVTGRAGLCDAFPGGPASKRPAKKEYEVVRADGRLRRDDSYGACVSRAAAYRILALLSDGAGRDRLLPQMRLLLHGESVPPEQALDAYLRIFKTGTLAGAPRQDLVKVGFFHHVLGARACRDVASPELRQECLEKAAALSAYKRKKPSECLKGDLLCRALLGGAPVCREWGERIVARRCAAPPPVLSPKKPKN